jgi:glycosyltransferase involved in cell wall biosynthesis
VASVTDALPGSQVTPAILTFNEAPNIGRTLQALTWARTVLVVDSGSSDSTEAIARGFPNVEWLARRFDNHAAQWRSAIEAAGAHSPYVLALDADYRVPATFVDELRDVFLPGGYAGGIAGFRYAMGDRVLSGSVYPAKLVIFDPKRLAISQPGHTQEMSVDGPVYRFTARLIHDDRKPLSRFVASQVEYSRLEAVRLGRNGAARWQDRLRRLGLMPLVAGVGAYVKSGGPFKGSASLRYAYERALFECLLALRLLDRGDRSGDDGPGKP